MCIVARGGEASVVPFVLRTAPSIHPWYFLGLAALLAWVAGVGHGRIQTLQ